MPSPLTDNDIALAHDLQATKRYFTALCALLWFEYALTFSEEIDRMWRGRRNPVFYLFLTNRYCPMAFCIITLSAYFSPLWTSSICHRFVIVQWIQTLLMVIPAESVLLYRINSMMTFTKKRVSIIRGLILLAAVQAAIVVYAMSRVKREKTPALLVPNIPIDPFHVCILSSEPHIETAYLAMTIAFDCAIFLLTAYVTFRSSSSQDMRALPSTLILKTIFRDGAAYFFVVISGNFIWMMLALFARPGLKHLNIQPSLILTTLMINRLTLSLRRATQLERTVVWGLQSNDWTSTGELDLDGNEPEIELQAVRRLSTPGAEIEFNTDGLGKIQLDLRGIRAD